MVEARQSFTATWVATMRGLGTFLPAPLKLVEDPYGLRFAGRLRALRENRSLERRARSTSRYWLRGPLCRAVVYWQLRSRVVDDALAAFHRAGGKQIVLLGAGFDCRAWRLPELAGSAVFEVDRPVTQAAKQRLMADEPPVARRTIIPWDFEHRPLAELAACLRAEGHDAAAPTITILEGVLMFLSPSALDATFDGIAGHSTPGSPFAMTYMDPAIFADKSLGFVRRRTVVRLMGEPFRSCFEPRDVPPWLAARGFRLEHDESAMQAGARLLGPTAASSRNGARIDRARTSMTSASSFDRCTNIE